MQFQVLLAVMRVYLSPTSLFVSINMDEGSEDDLYGIVIGHVIGKSPNQGAVVLFVQNPFTNDPIVAAEVAGKFLEKVCRVCRSKLESSKDNTARTLFENMLTDRFQRYNRGAVLNEEIIKKIVTNLREEGHTDTCPQDAT